MKTIIEMAREAHQELVTKDYPGHMGQLDPWTMTLLERFAALVRADEREACAQEADAQASIEGIAQRIAAAIRARGNT